MAEHNFSNGMTGNIVVSCWKCGNDFRMAIPADHAADPELRKHYANMAMCPGCANSIEFEESRREQKIREYELAEFYKNQLPHSGIERYLLPWDENHPAANHALMSFMRSNLKECVLLKSDSGRGKSRVMVNLADEVLRSGRSVYFSTAADLCDTLSAAFSGKEKNGLAVLERLRRVDLLVIDDLAKEAVSESRMMRLYQLIDSRYIAWEQKRKGVIRAAGEPRYGWQLWVATNWTAESLVERMGYFNGEPIIRRILDMCHVWTDQNNGGGEAA